MGRRAVATGVGAVLALILGACGDGPKGSGAGGGGAPAGEDGGRVHLVVLREVHADDFRGVLAEEHGEAEDPGVEWRAGVLWLDPEVAALTDPAALAAHGVTLADGDTPLSRCAGVVLWERVYAGAGRRGGARRVHGFAGPQGRLDLGLSEPPAHIDHDPGADGDLGARLLDLRLAPGPPGALEVRLAADGPARLSAFGVELVPGAGREATWAPARRVLAVRERALLAGQLEVEGLGPLAADEEVEPATDFGAIAFESTWSVHDHGPVPWRLMPAPAAGEELR